MFIIQLPVSIETWLLYSCFVKNYKNNWRFSYNNNILEIEILALDIYKTDK